MFIRLQLKKYIDLLSKKGDKDKTSKFSRNKECFAEVFIVIAEFS